METSVLGSGAESPTEKPESKPKSGTKPDEVDSATKTEYGSTQLSGSKTGSGSKMGPGSRKGAVSKTESGSKTDSGSKNSAGSKSVDLSNSGARKLTSATNRSQPATLSSYIAKNKQIRAARTNKPLKPVGLKHSVAGQTTLKKPPVPVSSALGVVNRRKAEVDEKVEKRDHTPDAAVVKPSPSIRSSTPTEEKLATRTELAEVWDASQISTVNSTQGLDLNDTTAIAPCQSLKFTRDRLHSVDSAHPLRDATQPPKNAALFARPRLDVSVRAPTNRTTVRRLAQTAFKSKKTVYTAMKVKETVAKGNATIVEDPEDISEEMMELAYCRYIQSEYIRRTSQKAEDRTKKECEEKLWSVWQLLELERFEVLRLELELALTNVTAALQDTYNRIGPVLGFHLDQGTEDPADERDLLELVGSIQARVQELCNGLEDVKHNIEVKGITIEGKDRVLAASRVLDLMREFNSKASSVDGLLHPDTLQTMKGLEDYCVQSESIVSLSRGCSDLVEACRRLATKEASLKISLNNL